MKGRPRLLLRHAGLGFVVGPLPGNAQDRDGARQVLRVVPRTRDDCRSQLIWADGGYRGKLIDGQVCLGWTLQIVEKWAVTGFPLFSPRWIVERTFAWLNFASVY